MVAAGDDHAVAVGERLGQDFRIAIGFPLAGHHEHLHRQCREPVGVERRVLRIGEGGQGLTVLALLVGELAEATQEGLGDAFGIVRQHRLGHHVAARRRAFGQHLVADPAQDEVGKPVRGGERRGRGDPRAHGIAE